MRHGSCTGARWKLPGAMQWVHSSAGPTLQAKLKKMECLDHLGFVIFTCDSSKCTYAFCAGAGVKAHNVKDVVSCYMVYGGMLYGA